ncbi:hypothetical protein B0J14DRAFT_115112 [Halenospora varia]|nr:hypothetical protein B0J14DRAFT_115112 [Halenospora varia]
MTRMCREYSNLWAAMIWGIPNNTAQTDFIQFISTTISGRKSIQVLYKLGNGGLTTVWLCRDLETKTYVGLKILIAGASTDDCAELKLAEMGWDTKESGGNRLALQSTIFALTDQMVVIFAWCSRSLDL